jgi:hypothetical protein
MTTHRPGFLLSLISDQILMDSSELLQQLVQIKSELDVTNMKEPVKFYLLQINKLN